MPNISVIIPSYNRAAFLPALIKSFEAQTIPREDFELIIVNNNSPDNTEEILASLKSSSGLNLFSFLEKRQGVHYARNAAVKKAKGDFLYYTDDDMVADPYMLERLVSVFELDDRIGCATGQVLPKWKASPPIWVEKYFGGGWLSLQERSEDLIIAPYDMGVWSCHQMIRRDVFLQTNGFHPENTEGEWIGDGETGLNLKIRELGYKFAFVGSSITYHTIPEERITQQYFNKRAKNQGCSDCYSEYRAYHANNHWLFRAIMGYIKQLISCFFITSKNYLTGNDSWHWYLARCYYWLARIKYDFRLLHDNTLKELVSQKTYLE